MRDGRRLYLNLRYGLSLPRYALLNSTNSVQANQPYIDLVCVTSPAGTAVSLVAPADPSLDALLTTNWLPANRRATVLHAAGGLTTTQFTNAATTADFLTAFNTSAAGSGGPGTLPARWPKTR